jgi:hypothetical protein
LVEPSAELVRDGVQSNETGGMRREIAMVIVNDGEDWMVDVSDVEDACVDAG